MAPRLHTRRASLKLGEATMMTIVMERRIPGSNGGVEVATSEDCLIAGFFFCRSVCKSKYTVMREAVGKERCSGFCCSTRIAAVEHVLCILAWKRALCWTRWTIVFRFDYVNRCVEARVFLSVYSVALGLTHRLSRSRWLIAGEGTFFRFCEYLPYIALEVLKSVCINQFFIRVVIVKLNIWHL